MSTSLLTLLCLAVSLISYSQPRSISAEDSIQIEMKVTAATQRIITNDQGSKFLTQLVHGFKTDTLKIEERMRLKLEIDYSTSGMVGAAYDAEAEYDELLNKYYKLLMSRLGETEKNALRQSQRNWIEYRDSERELNQLLTSDHYSGGGTIQRVIAASKYLDITKTRVIDLYQYLNRGYE